MVFDFNNDLFSLIKQSLGEVCLGITKQDIPNVLLDHIKKCEELFTQVKKCRIECTSLELNEQERLIIIMCIAFTMGYLTSGEFHSRTGIYIEEARKIASSLL